MAKYLNIKEEAVQSYIRPGGKVNDLLNDVAKGTYHYSQRYIMNGHMRSGRLFRGLFWNRAKLTGPLQGVARAGSSAKHTLYFHDGTANNGTGMIRHPRMIVPKNRHAAHTSLAYRGAGEQQLARWKARTAGQRKRGSGVWFKNEVRGQRSKPFLREGLAVSLANQGLK